MAYITIKKERAIGEFEERKSEFIGHIKRVTTEEEARAFINEIKNKHKQATHNVYAYIIGENMGIQRYTDDGEPQGTAGIPMLEVIKKNNLTDCCIVVTRYFGGILLGTGGLVRAYSKGASVAIKEAGIVEKVKGVTLKITMDYDLLGKVQYVCMENNWHIEDSEYTDKVTIYILCEEHVEDKIRGELIESTNGKIIIERTGEGIYFKEGYRLYSII
ncbi:YigZ family protein [Clostridium sp.]|uniref:YigZ family protein n=1 Tax=Clostridium sp. TaxID=1506 RepID=UPI0034646122